MIKQVLVVNCGKAIKEPCYYNKEEFYIRLNPQASLLKGIDMNYVLKRFSK